MEPDVLYELVNEAVKAALDEREGGEHVRLAARMVEGKVVFHDLDDKVVKEVPAPVFFKKITSIRDKLRVLEQKINSHPDLRTREKAELQDYITRCYGTLTTFNFLFRDGKDRFIGTGGGSTSEDS